MSLSIKSLVTRCRPDTEIVNRLLELLAADGYEPLIKNAKKKFIQALGGLPEDVLEIETLQAQGTYQTAYVRHYYQEEHLPLAGELFLSSSSNELYYIALHSSEPRSTRRRLKQDDVQGSLEAGFITERVDADNFEKFTSLVSGHLTGLGIDPAWNQIQPYSPQFLELTGNADNKFVLASSLSSNELEIAKILEDASIRDLAIVVKRSGGILANDLMRRSGLNTTDAPPLVKHLNTSGLLAKEYVVICRKTSNQINRVDSKEKLEKMRELGVLCSCGNPVTNERVEELFVPTPILQRMLNQSFWMTATLVQSLKRVEIPEERILLNLQEGAEEIDAFVDVEGSLIMLELKDNEFSMGHAYPFGGRIGLYKPDFAVVVSTKGIAPDVRDYFQRIKPAAEIVYIGSLTELDANLRKITTTIRSKKARDLLGKFEPMANVQVPLAQLLSRRISTRKAASKSAS